MLQLIEWLNGFKNVYTMPQEIHFTSKAKKLTVKNGKRYSIQVGIKESCDSNT